MTTRINPQNHHAEQLAQNTQARETHMQGVKLHSKFQHIKAQKAAFWRNKRFAAAHHKPPSASAQKLLRQLGQRPQPGQFAKSRGKDAAKERPKHEHEHEDGAHEQKHQHENEHEQKHQHEHEHGQGQSHDDQHGDGRGQSQQQAPRDGQQRERREKQAKFAIKIVKTKRSVAAPADLQAIAEQHLGSPDQRKVLAAAYARAVVRLSMKSELGPLLAPMLLLNMTSPAVLKRNLARLRAHSTSTLALGTLVAGKEAVTAGLVGHSLDMTLARQRFGIAYTDDDQSLAMVKERLIDALAAMPEAAAAAAAKRAPIASEKAQEVRAAPGAPGAKP
ncbi:MAG TPA: helicase [Trinickia sp.]|nr:helicase [Trinickia sp.]